MLKINGIFMITIFFLVDSKSDATVSEKDLKNLSFYIIIQNLKSEFLEKIENSFIFFEKIVSIDSKSLFKSCSIYFIYDMDCNYVYIE